MRFVTGVPAAEVTLRWGIDPPPDPERTRCEIWIGHGVEAVVRAEREFGAGVFEKSTIVATQYCNVLMESSTQFCVFVGLARGIAVRGRWDGPTDFVVEHFEYRGARTK
jgi:hypothetical protein